MAANFGSKVSMTGIDKLASAIDQHDLKVKRAIAGVFLRSQDDAISLMRRGLTALETLGLDFLQR
jgi:translation initiation factor IF-3